MPYLQLDIPERHSAALKQRLARRFGEIFADVMQTTPEKVVVAIRELEEASLWRCGAGEPEPAAVLSCDIRRGRPAAQRARLAEALTAACTEVLGWPSTRLSVSFTQHAGDEVFKPGQGLGRDWAPAEAQAAITG